MGLKPNKTGDAALWQILDVNLFRRFPLTQDEFWHETGAIGSSMKFRFQPYIERPKPTSYAIWASFLLHAAPGLRTGLELELIWVSTLGTRTGLALNLLVDLDTLFGLLLLHAMLPSWPYAWVPCPHHPPLLDEKPSSASIVLETDPAKHKGEQGCENKWN